MGVFRAEYKHLGVNGRLYLIFISYFWLYEYFSAFWRRISAKNDSIINFVVFIILALICRRTWRRMLHLSDILLYFFIAFMYLFSTIIYTSTQEIVYSNAFEVICCTFPFLLLGIIFKAKEYAYWITILSRITIIINIVYSLLLSSSAETGAEEQMHKAYILLPSLLFLLWQFIENFKLVDFGFFLLGFLMVCSMGSRGPFVCTIFFFATYLLFFKEWKHAIIVRILIIVFSLLIYGISEYFAFFMIYLLSLFGKSTRIFNHMLENSLVNYESSNGRNLIHEELFRILSTDSNGLGFGLFSDRVATNGDYAHNIFIELWFSFGYFIGSIVAGAILILFLKFLYRSKDTYMKIFFLIFFTASFVKLSFSGSFIFDCNLFFFIGLCINGLRESWLYKKRIKCSNI